MFGSAFARQPRAKAGTKTRNTAFGIASPNRARSRLQPQGQALIEDWAAHSQASLKRRTINCTQICPRHFCWPAEQNPPHDCNIEKVKSTQAKTSGPSLSKTSEGEPISHATLLLRAIVLTGPASHTRGRDMIMKPYFKTMNQSPEKGQRFGNGHARGPVSKPLLSKRGPLLVRNTPANLGRQANCRPWNGARFD